MFTYRASFNPVSKLITFSLFLLWKEMHFQPFFFFLLLLYASFLLISYPLIRSFNTILIVQYFIFFSLHRAVVFTYLEIFFIVASFNNDPYYIFIKFYLCRHVSSSSACVLTMMFFYVVILFSFMLVSMLETV